MSPSYEINDKVILITGAAAGIGRALAVELHRRGARLALLDVDAKACAAAAASFAPERALALAADVRDRPAMAAAIEQVLARYGQLDVVVANAGVSPGLATLRTMTAEAFDRVIGINLTGVFNTVQPALEPIIARQGHVVVVSSVAAFAPGAGGAPYMISKAAVEQFGRALRLELAPFGASAGVAYFGLVDTGMTRDSLDGDPLGQKLDRMLPWPLNRRISAEQAARVIADDICRRAPRTIAPSAWRPYSLLRGVVNVLIDRQMAGDRRVHELVRQIEAQTTEHLHRKAGPDPHSTTE